LIYPQVTGIPEITTEEMIEVDRMMVKDLGVVLIQMMENAGQHLAQLTRALFLDGNARNRSALVLAGPGGNGGGALVCARHLQNWGARVGILITAPEARMSDATAQQCRILRRMSAAITHGAPPPEAGEYDVIVDGLVGYGLTGAPRGMAADLIRWANAQRAPVLSLDVPSGIASTTGEVYDPAIRASATMTLALPKSGLRAPGAADCVGDLYLADISVPASVYAQLPRRILVGEIFSESSIVRLADAPEVSERPPVAC
jgi:NAD(P)H-hydrate epimerase